MEKNREYGGIVLKNSKIGKFRIYIVSGYYLYKQFSDLDFSKCISPDKSPYNNPNRINKCGGYK